MDSRTSTFVSSYNQSFNEFANRIAASYFSRVKEDIEVVKDKSSGILQSKVRQIDTLINEQNGNTDEYAKVKMIGMILLDETKDLLSDTQPEIRKCGANIINGFFDVARKTEDSELLKTMQAIRKSADEVIKTRTNAVA